MRALVEPTHFWAPPYTKTFGPEVADLCDAAGFAPDPEQRLALDVIFGRRDDNLSAAFETGVVVGRQNLKTGLFLMAAFGWMWIVGEGSRDLPPVKLIVYSAHEFTTAMETFRIVSDIITGSDVLRPDVKRVIRNHGEEAVELKWGSRLIFKTRTKGGSRGLTGDKVILDEAFALRPMHMGALLPTISARPDPQVLYGSSAGMADSDVLRDVRDRGRAGGEPRLAYLEWCAPPPSQVCEAGDACTHARGAVGCGCESPDNWVRANPALGRRRSNGTGLSFEYVTAERRAMPPREFCRERMGWWDDPAEGASPLPMSSWMACCKVKSRPSPDSVIAVGLDISPDSAVSALGVAAWRDDGLMHVELAEHLPGTGWVLDRLLGMVGRRNPCAVVLDPAGPAGAFERYLRQANFITLADDKPVPDGKRRLVLASGRVLAQACGAFANMVQNQEVGHPDQQPLNSAVESVRSRPVAQAWAYRPVPGADITPVAAVTLAAHGLAVHGKKQPPVPFVLV